MGARRTINRYRTTPSGYDYADVLKRGKRFHTHSDAHSKSAFLSSLNLFDFLQKLFPIRHASTPLSGIAHEYGSAAHIV